MEKTSQILVLEESLPRLADILREQYPGVYQSILMGKDSNLLKGIASILITSEEELRKALISYESRKIVTLLKIPSTELEALKDMVDHMTKSP